MIHKSDEATGFLPARGDQGKPITVIGTDAIRENFDTMCLEQALNSRSAPGVSDLILNPDAHAGCLADQLLLPMALAGGGRMRTMHPSNHARTWWTKGL